MRILALETSTESASCAIWQDGCALAAECPPDEPHSATLIPLAERLLAEAGGGFAALDAIAVDMGPGAFTSLRVSCAIAQGMAVALDLPILPVGSLECLAWQAGGRRVLSLIDARMGEVYVGAFARREDGVTPLAGARLCRPEAIVPPDGEGWQAAGNAIAAHPLLAERLAASCVLSAVSVPHARGLAELAAFALRRGEGVDPALALPRYVRDKVARTTAERLGVSP
jgi:tRNA threonylcarbamoyladenosine biosynthesis protein TsaB